ncbi:MAG: hypothetical protein RL172_1009 [Bacteroidota bacterium]|jgi:outer membrane protein OmpA-like peptidoglycan-associated protein
MRRLTLLALLVLFISSAHAQQPTKARYTVSGGLLAAYNSSKFRIGGNNTGNVKYDRSGGFAGGIWLNFPVSNGFSIEPQVLYSIYGYKNTNLSNLLLNDGKISYISVPLLMKFHLGRSFAITAGPQFDFVSTFEDNRNNADKEDFKGSSVSLSGGVELFPHDRLTLFARYIHGLTNMDNTGNPNTAIKYYNQAFQVGLKLKLFGKFIPADSDGDGILDPKDKCPNQPGFERYAGCPIPDTDGDGVNDEEDKCPNQAGLAKYGGCPIPDTDGDGVNDEEDKCPNQAGLAKYQGCPIPDTDGDGINDEMDKCPTQPGLEKYQGCPIPDSDGDGINDEEDRCPNEPGVPEMKGCKKIETFEASQVTFASGKSVLTAAGKKELDVVAAFMKRAPEGLKIKLSGHTDASGKDAINDPLSAARAEAAKTYLVSQGIDASRISTEGFGSKMPVADNKTAKGKALNRRVEVSIE